MPSEPRQLTPAHRWLIAFVVAGLAWRVGRYLLHFPLWGDEAFVACDVLDRNYAELFANPPEYFQVVPLLFRWIERAAVQLLGPGELALRLFPLLAGCGALLLFARLCWTTLAPWPATIATGIFAAAYPLARHANEVKPYAGDAFCATLVLWAALRWTRKPADPLRAVVLSIATATAVWLSFPVILVAAGVGAGLLFSLPRRQWLWLAGYVTAVAASFVCYYQLYAHTQVARSAGSWLEEYWKAGFPPHELGGGLLWLLRAHASEMLSYPLGGVNFGSTLNAVLLAVGVIAIARSPQRPLLGVLLLPFAAGITAAVLHRYPYGTAARLAQHLAPFICLLIGVGVGWLQERITQDRWRSCARVAITLSLLAIPAVGFARDISKPYKFEDDVIIRAYITQQRRALPPGATISVVNPPEVADDPAVAPAISPVARYYLTVAGYRLVWLAGAELPLRPGWLAACHYHGQRPQSADLEALLRPAGLRIRSIVRGPDLASERTVDFYEVESAPAAR